MNDLSKFAAINSCNLDMDIIDKISETKRIENQANYIATEATAKKMAELIHKEITDYQNSLDSSYDVALKIIQFGQSYTLLVDRVGYRGVNILCFYGNDSSGNPLCLLQHLSQLNFLIVPVKQSEPTLPKRTIGFAIE